MWKTVKLYEVATVSAGNSAPQDERLFKDGLYHFVRTSDVGKIHRGTIFKAKDKLNNNGISKLRLFPKGTILYPKSGASTFLNHRVMLGMNAYVSSHLATIKGNSSKILDSYLFYLLQTIDSANLVTDSGYPSLKTKTISEIELVLPPLKVQQHIVAKLDTLFEKIDSLIIASKNQKNDLISLLQKKIDKEYLNFRQYITFDKIVLNKGTGLERKAALQSSDKKYLYLKMNNITKNNQLDFEKFVSVDADEVAVQKYSLEKGDFLFNTRNSTELVGKSAVFYDERKWLFNNNILRIKFKSEISPKFINFFLSSTNGKKQLESMKTGTTSVAAIYYKNLVATQIPLASLETQEKIVKNIEEVSNRVSFLKRIYQQKIFNLKALKSVILIREIQREAA